MGANLFLKALRTVVEHDNVDLAVGVANLNSELGFGGVEASPIAKVSRKSTAFRGTNLASQARKRTSVIPGQSVS